MSHLIVNETPKGPFEYLVIAFAGWADASEAATTPIKYLNRKLKSTKFAELDPEEFYDFTQTRPHTTRTKGGKRLVHWPANDFYYWVPKNAGKGVVFCLGVEPNLKWRTFTAAINRARSGPASQNGGPPGSIAGCRAPYSGSPPHGGLHPGGHTICLG